MSTINLNLKNALVALGLAVSASAWATPVTLTGISGSYTVWDGGTTLLPAANPGLNAAAAALGGNSGAPGGNVELGKFGQPTATTLTGTGSGHSITLSSLLLSDWTANGDALARRYIQDAAAAAGISMSSTSLTAALGYFYGLSIGPYKPWQLVSDPNISYVELAERSISVGLAGLFDATDFLNQLIISSGTGISLLPPRQQVSEVVKLSFDGSDPIYLYGFKATESGVSTSPDPDDLTASYTGNYDVAFVPEPAGIALFGLALFGLVLARRRT